MSDAKIAQIVDLALQIQGLCEEVLGESSSKAFQPASPSSPLVSDAMKTLEPFPRFVPDTFVESLAGQIVGSIIIKEVNTGRGPVDIAEVSLTDGATNVVVTMWEDLSKAVETYQAGESITITNLKVNKPYKGVESLSSTRNTKVS